MKREIGTGIQDFGSLRVNGDFYVDKTDFIREWWQGRDAVTLITRPSDEPLLRRKRAKEASRS